MNKDQYPAPAVQTLNNMLLAGCIATRTANNIHYGLTAKPIHDTSVPAAAKLQMNVSANHKSLTTPKMSVVVHYGSESVP